MREKFPPEMPVCRIRRDSLCADRGRLVVVEGLDFEGALWNVEIGFLDSPETGVLWANELTPLTPYAKEVLDEAVCRDSNVDAAEVAFENGCTPFWHGPFKAFCCDCADGLHFGDQQCSIISKKSAQNRR